MHADLFADPAVLADVVAVIRAVMGQADLEPDLDTPLEAIEGWDSLWHVTVTVELESRFDVKFQPHEMEAVQTVGDIVRMIGARRALDAA